MKRLSLLFLFILIGCGAQPPIPTPVPSPVTKDWTITNTWTYDFTNFLPCSVTVTKGCVSGFSWGYIQSTTQVPLKTSPATVCTGTVQPETCTDTANSTLGIGPTVFYLQANGIDNNGNAVTSAQVNYPSQTVAIGNPVIGTVTLR